MYGYVLAFWSNTTHKLWHLYYTLVFCAKLIARSLGHDLSKYTIAEWANFAKVVSQLSKVEFRSPEYKELLSQISSTIRLHKSRNRHHPEFYKGGFKEMTAADRLEMVFDWCAAARRNKNGNVYASLEQSRERLGYSSEDAEWIRLVIDEVKK